jgi:hypothetical protein
MADTTYYVDTDVVGGSGDGSSWANAFDHLADAEALNLDLTTGATDGVCTIFCRGAKADDLAISWNGWTTDAGGYVNIIGDFAGTAWNAAKYHISVVDASAFQIAVNNVHLLGMQIEAVSPTAGGRHCLWTSASEVWIARCFVRGHGNATYDQRGIYGNTAGTVKIWNCILVGFSTGSNSGPIYTTGGGTFLVYSTVGIGGETGFWNSSGTAIAKNCYFGGSGYSSSSDYYGTITKTTCASEDSSGTSGLQNIALSTATFANVTGGSEDFSLVTGSALIDVGTDTSGDAAPLNFTDDIKGTARGATWDVGADEYTAAGGGAVVPIIMAQMNQFGGGTRW